jgi:Domain of unknown function (DUF697)
MNKTFKKIILLASLLILLFFVLFVINQTAQVVQLADKVSSLFGRVVFWALLLIYTVLLLIPVLLFLRLPSPLIPPKDENTPEFDAYLRALKKRLAHNSYLKGHELSTRGDIEAALAILGKKSDEIIQETATTVFISTAISQSGRLDAFLVLGAQSRMVWRIARVHYQRPTLRDLIHLYANVAGTVFLASELDDLDISEQVEPVLSSTLGALAVSIPGIQLAASLLVNSVLSGTANAFLTLRVGIIAKRYCGSLVLKEKRNLRRAASAEAALLLGSIVKAGTAKLSKAFLKASKGKLSGLFSNAKAQAKEAGNFMLSKLGLTKTKEALLAEIMDPGSALNDPLDPETPDPKHTSSKQ